MTRLDQIMSTGVETVDTADTIDDARAVMQDLAVHALPVVDTTGAVVGIVSSLDLADDYGPGATVAAAMADQVHRASPDTDAAMAALILRDLRINHLVVVDDDRLVGMVSSWDLLEALAGAVRSRTVAGTDAPSIARGDELVVRRPDGPPQRCRIDDVRGPSGLPPYVVVWDDDPSRTPVEIDVVRHTDVSLDGCER